MNRIKRIGCYADSRLVTARVRIVACAIAAFAGLGAGGCPQSPGKAGELTRGTLAVDGRARSYLLFTPSSYDENGDRAFPLVLAFHGGGGDGEGMRTLTSFDDEAQSQGFLVVFPDGVDGNWNDGRPGINNNIDDVAFVAALLDDFEARLRIDKNRIYATGMSNGGHLSQRLAFDLPGRFAAIAPVAALLSEALAGRSETPKPIPILMIDGDADPISPFAGGVVGGDLLDRGVVLSADDATAYWQEVNDTPKLTGDAVWDADPNDGTRALDRAFSEAGAASGEQPSQTEFIVVENGGHTWPGGKQYLPESLVGVTSKDFSATETIWRFFAAHPRQ